ncbi:DUF6318 family protein [Timonella senegalensis]|uniref:DUF6318 family protein n=1 Tax=Timonella senegalensis TaxID=1465825 RepID=UPI002DD9748A|nr:DUF6318 family protein [Timonella senegalensis]
MRIRRERGAAWLLLAIAAVMGLGACSASGLPGGTDRPVPTVTATATTSPSPEETEPAEPAPTLPPKPAAMSEETEEGAIATVRYFIDAVNMAYATNDPNYFEDLATDDCKLCGSISAAIKDASLLKQQFENYELSIGELSAPKTLDEGWTAFKVDVTQGNILLRNPDGSEEVISESQTVTPTIFVLDFIEGSWRVLEATS